MKEKDAGRISVVPPNDPLTLNELREMGGEPVWCLEMRCWGIIKLETIGCGQFGGGLLGAESGNRHLASILVKIRVAFVPYIGPAPQVRAY